MKQINIDVTQKSNNSKVPKNLSSLPQTSGEQSQGRFFVDINGKSYFITFKQLITLAQSGVVVLDSTGRVPQSLLPSYVDDVIEYENKSAFPMIGESGKIYIDLKTNLSYRWGGTTYVEISPSLALGETDSTAYAGSKGKQNAENIKSLQDRMGIAETDISNVKSDARKAKEWVEGVGTSITNWFGDAIETTDNFNDALQQKVMGVAWDFPEKITAHVDVYTQFTFEFESNGEKFKRISYDNWRLNFVEEKSGTSITVYPSDDWYKYRRIYTDDLNVSLEAIGATKDDTVTIGDRLSNGFQGIRSGIDDFKTNFKNGINTLNSNFNSLVSRITGVAWELKDITKTVLPNKPIIHEFEFISNGIKFNRMRYYNYNAPAQDCNLAYRRSDDGEEIIVYEYTQSNSIWQNEAYKTVITDDIDVSLEDIGAEINFELSIAERLGKKSKTVLGAIENLFDVEEIGNDIKGWLEGIDDSISKFGSFVVDKIKSVGQTLFGSKEEVEQNTADIGDMSQLEIGGATTFNLRATPTKTTLVDAINNVHGRLQLVEETSFPTHLLETTDKTIVGAINELNDVLTIKSGEAVTDLTGTTWKLNDTLVVEDEEDYIYNLEFISNNTSFVGFNPYKIEDDRGDVHYLTYYGENFVIVYDNGWRDGDTYKTINITGGTETKLPYLINWLYANGELVSGDGQRVDISTLQPKEDNNLETESKEVIGAINEVNRKTLDKLAYMEGEAPDSVSIQDDGIRQGYKIRLANDDDGSFTEELVEVYNTIPIVAGENISFETSADRKTIKINATGGGSSTPSMIGTWTVVDEPEIPTTEIPLVFTSNGVNYDKIGFGSTGPSFWGISALKYFLVDGTSQDVYTNNPSGDYGITHGWADEAYKTITVTEEPKTDSAIAWLGANTNAPKVNTPKPCLEMPQIRFAGMPCDGWFGDVDLHLVEGIGQEGRYQYNLKFTIEIVGGGALQIGDTIQICRVKSYGASSSIWKGNTKFHPKKKKLRKYVEYTITEEDLDKRFITLIVPWNDKKARRLFERTTTIMSGLSPLYFRIRRPKGDTFTNRDGKEYTSEAEFSNVVTVWKTCYTGAWLDPDTEEQIDYYKIKLV